MSTPVVVDSSVAYKWLSRDGEDSVEQAEELLDDQDAGRIVLVGPSILHVELANALRHSPLARDDVVMLVEELPSFGIELFETTPERLGAATAVSYRHGLSIYDALFLALAEELDCPLVSADRRAFGGVQASVEIRLL